MYNKNIGRSLCQSRPVSMPEPAGLYAGVGRSLCRPTLSDCVAVPSGGFFFGGEKGVPEINNAYLLKNDVCL